MRALLVAVLVLTSVGAPLTVRAGPAPGWVRGAAPRFPRERFLTGVGEGATRVEAEDRARAEIAKIFSSAVSVSRTDELGERSAAGPGGAVSSAVQRVAQVLRVDSQALLEGVEIADSFFDEVGARHHALAVLDRERAARALRQRLEVIDQEAQGLRQTLEAAGARLSRARAGWRWLQILRDRDARNAELRVLAGAGLPALPQEGALRALAAQATFALVLSVVVRGASSPLLVGGLLRGARDAGLAAVLARGEPADLVIECQVEVAPLAGGADGLALRFVRATLTGTLREGSGAPAVPSGDGRARDAGGRVLAEFSLSERQAAPDEGEAERRALAGLGKQASGPVSRALREFMAGP